MHDRRKRIKYVRADSVLESLQSVGGITVRLSILLAINT